MEEVKLTTEVNIYMGMFRKFKYSCKNMYYYTKYYAYQYLTCKIVLIAFSSFEGVKFTIRHMLLPADP